MSETTTQLPSESTGKAVRVGPDPAVPGELFDELSALAAEHGCELLHVARHANTLQLVLDHPEAVTLEHCSAVSREAGAVLDVHDYGSGRYVLEVSSPGLDRLFYRLEDYQRYLGRRVKVVHRSQGRKATARGELAEFDADSATIVLHADDSREPLRVHLRDVLSTRLEVEL